MPSVIGRTEGIVADFPLRASDAPPTELFKGLGEREIDVILASAMLRRFSRKSLMTHQSGRADHLFLLWKGRARYFFETPNGKRLNLIWITPGHIFGATALVSQPSTYLVSTEAVRETVVLTWAGATIRALARRFPRLLENVLLTSVDYLAWYIATHAALTSQTASERLAHVLAGYASSIGQRTLGGIELDVTNEELANATNISLYTTSRILSEWHRKGVIRKRHRRILLRSPEKFFRSVT
jgi:CRP-like cAMP-binding protein